MNVDLLMIGQPSLDVNVDHTGAEVREVGGAVTFSSYAAAALGHSVLALVKCSPAEIDPVQLFAAAPRIAVRLLPGTQSTSVQNVYHTADKERRTCRAIQRIAPYTAAELPADVQPGVIQIAGLMRGDIAEEVIEAAARVAPVGVDVQGFLRCADETGAMHFEDWPRKKELLPLITYLKTDAAEAQILTGTEDRRAAAALLHGWGAKEVMITHNTEVLIYDGVRYYTCPLRPRNLSGRSGRGDTTFAVYITERLTQPIAAALQTAAALVSVKMETPGPFKGTRAAVAQRIKEEAFDVTA
jgi:sugar/nucleoside kinase (ribokinase family)